MTHLFKIQEWSSVRGTGEGFADVRYMIQRIHVAAQGVPRSSEGTAHREVEQTRTGVKGNPSSTVTKPNSLHL